MKNILGLVIVLIYVLFVMGLASFLYKKKKLDLEESRKLMHIGLCNCYLIAWLFFDNRWAASLLPFLFILFNLYSHFHKTVKAMERKEDTLGTVWYALALTILTFVLFDTKNFVYIGAIAVLVLGYGDGLAALLGNAFGKHRFSNGKSLLGSLVMFVTSFVVSYAILNFSIGDYLYLYCFIIASFASAIELISPKGTDNLFLPLGLTALIYYMTLNPVILDWSTAASINLCIALIVSGFGFLDAKGTCGAFLLGTVTYAIGGEGAYLALITFFVSVNLLTYHPKKKKKTSRSIKNVICNGLPELVLLIVYQITGNMIWLVGFLMALAGACSDTWSSELGKKGKSPVKYILSRKKVDKGLSGGVTILGLTGGMIGSFLIAIFALFIFKEQRSVAFLLIFLTGFVNSLIDSVLGELVQAKFQHKKTKKIVEKKQEGSENYTLVKGISWIGNNAVNLFSILLSTIFGLLIYFILTK